MIVYLPGVRWDGVPGTDRRLVESLGRHVPVLWVDPPESALRLPVQQARTWWEHPAAHGVRVLRTAASPGFTRPGIRRVAEALQRRAIHRFARRTSAVVVSDANRHFPKGFTGPHCYYVTDDAVAGARLMGLSESAVRATRSRNLRRAHLVAAVSPVLLSSLRSEASLSDGASVAPDFLLLPNGCSLPAPEAGISVAVGGQRGAAPPRAVLVGQLNERLDLEALEALTRRRIPVIVAGTRTDREPGFGARLDAWLRQPSVEWVGHVAPERLPALLSSATVGLTPYADSAFNRASFPLKTLEYLASGLPVVATDHPAVHWLSTPLVDVAESASSFADLVHRRLEQPRDEERPDRRRLVERHTWDVRAQVLLRALAQASGARESAGIACAASGDSLSTWR